MVYAWPKAVKFPSKTDVLRLFFSKSVVKSPFKEIPNLPKIFQNWPKLLKLYQISNDFGHVWRCTAVRSLVKTISCPRYRYPSVKVTLELSYNGYVTMVDFPCTCASSRACISTGKLRKRQGGPFVYNRAVKRNGKFALASSLVKVQRLRVPGSF